MGRGGTAEVDNAHTWLQLETSEVPGSASVRLAARPVRRLFIRQFLRHFDPAVLRPTLPEVAEYRLGVRELAERERQMIPVFVGRTMSRA